MNQFLFTLGIIIVVLTGFNVLFNMVLPRSPRGFERTSLLMIRAIQCIFTKFSTFAKSYEAKDGILAITGPLAIVVQLLFWAGCLIVGFAFMLYSTTANFADAFHQAAVGLFTIGSVRAGGIQNTTIDIVAGAIWVIVVALQIGYLPTLYAAFNRREGLVALLESRSGVPAWGPEILARQQLVGITDTLPDFYAAWEVWSADLAESHTTYPVLLLFRSPEPWLSWLVGLLSVLDAAAMQLALAPSGAPSQARLCLRMGFTALSRIARTLGWEVNPDPDPAGPIELAFEDFEAAVRMLRESGFPMERTAEEAWPDFVGWRVNYEHIAYRLATQMVVPPAPWSGSDQLLRSNLVLPRRPPQRTPERLSFRTQHPSGTGSDDSSNGDPVG